MSDYIPPSNTKVKIILGESPYNPQAYNRVSINLTPDQKIGEAQYIGGDGWSSDFLSFGQLGLRLKTRYVSNVTAANSAAYGHATIRNQRDFISPSGINLNTYGRPTIYNLNRYIVGRGLSSFISGRANVQSTLAYIRPTGLNSFSPGTAKAQSSKIEAKGFNSFTAGQPKIESLRSYIRAGAYNFFVSGKIRISYKEQHATTKQEKESTLWGKTLIAYGVRYVEQNSPSALTRFGTAWASFSPRFIEPRGIFQQFPSYHRIGGSQTVKMEGFDFLRFGTRIIPESQSIRPDGFSTLFGDAEIYNYVQHIKPKGFLTVGEKLDLRWGQQKVFNNTQYILPFHTDQDKTTGAWAYKDYWTEEPLEILNRNRTIQTHGRLSTVFGYADLTNKARVIYPVGLASPIEVEPTKTLVADGIRYIKPVPIEAPYFSDWNKVWLGAQAKTMQGPVLTLYGVPYIENTRRIYRFISLGEQTLFGKGMISHAVRGIRIQEDYSIAPPVIPMPEVKLGVRYVEPSSIDSVRYGWPHLAEQFTKIAPHWVQINRVGEPVIRNVTPQVRPWQFESAKYGTAYVGLYTRHIKPDGLSAQQFSRAWIGDRKQGVDLRSYGIQPPTITKLHKIENVGAGQLLPHVIYPRPITTANFETHPDKLHKIRQNVIRPESEEPMTLFGKAVVTANSIRVEPGLWENLIGTAIVEYKNRRVRVDSSENDFLKIGKPTMSPHTIWATDDPPQQAIRNHPDQRLPLHHIGGYSEELGRLVVPGIKFGSPNIQHRRRLIAPPGLNSFEFSKPTMRNTRFLIAPKGMSTLRFGVIAPIGDQTISFRINAAHSQYGSAKIENIKPYNNNLKPSGIALMNIGKPVIDHYHRNIAVPGLDSLSMGRSKSGDSPYMWQGLRIGPNVPTRVGGDIHSRYGTAWISPRVREVLFKGQDYSLVGEYEPGNFNLKLQIWNRTQPEPPTYQLVRGIGFMSQQMGTPDIKLAVHYIRPYGNTDNYRKGGLDTNA